MEIMKCKTLRLLTIKLYSMSPLQRIQRVMRFNYNRGICKESVVTVYRKIINSKLK